MLHIGLVSQPVDDSLRSSQGQGSGVRIEYLVSRLLFYFSATS